MSDLDPVQRLLDGEAIIWSGRPYRGLMLSGRDAIAIPFSVVFTAIVVVAMAAAMKEPSVLPELWTAPFVLAGLYLMAGRFIADAWLRRKTSYAVTERRILIVRSAPFGKITSLPLDQLPKMELSERADGRGTLRFGAPPGGWWRFEGDTALTPSLDSTPQFIGIDDARRVFNQIQRAIRDRT